MITIEVLISMLILFLVIVASLSNIKFFNLVNKKKESYEDYYMTVLSLKDKLSLDICEKKQKIEGEFNGFTYTATCEKKKELRTYYYPSVDNKDLTPGNKGDTLVLLYLVQLELKINTIEKSYSYYVTRYEK